MHTVLMHLALQWKFEAINVDMWTKYSSKPRRNIWDAQGMHWCPLISQHHFDGYFLSNISCTSSSKYFFLLYFSPYSEYSFFFFSYCAPKQLTFSLYFSLPLLGCYPQIQNGSNQKGTSHTKWDISGAWCWFTHCLPNLTFSHKMWDT